MNVISNSKGIQSTSLSVVEAESWILAVKSERIITFCRQFDLGLKRLYFIVIPFAAKLSSIYGIVRECKENILICSKSAKAWIGGQGLNRTVQLINMQLKDNSKRPAGPFCFTKNLEIMNCELWLKN